TDERLHDPGGALTRAAVEDDGPVGGKVLPPVVDGRHGLELGAGDPGLVPLLLLPYVDEEGSVGHQLADLLHAHSRYGRMFMHSPRGISGSEAMVPDAEDVCGGSTGTGANVGES